MTTGLNDQFDEVMWLKKFPVWLRVFHGISPVSAQVIVMHSTVLRLNRIYKQITASDTITVLEFQDRNKSKHTFTYDQVFQELSRRAFFPCIMRTSNFLEDLIPAG